MDRISPDALAVLQSCTVDGVSQTVTLPPGNLPRAVYTAVDDVLSRIGGKWVKKLKTHQFPYDPAPLFDAVLASEELPPKNPSAFFPTPKQLVDEMIEVADIRWRGDGTRVLEPSAGTGAIAKAVRDHAIDNGAEWIVDCCEYLGVNRTALEQSGFRVVAQDFTKYDPGRIYDVVLMNPPFSLEGDATAYITHCNHAWSLLREGGSFVAVVPPGWTYRKDKKSTAFREFVCQNLEFWEVGSGAFKESGTMTNTMVIYGRKQATSWKTQPYNGWSSYHAWHCGLLLDNEYAIYQQVHRPGITRAEFVDVVDREMSQKIQKEGVAIHLQPSDYDALWQYYQEDQD